MWVAFTAIIAIFYAIHQYRQLFKNFEKIDDMFPGQPTLPLLGNVMDFYGGSHDLYNRLIHLFNLYRRSFRIWLGPLLFIVLYKPSEIEAVLNNTVHIRKGNTYNILLAWIKRGLLTSFGDKWRKNRKVLTPAFHFKILDGFLEVFNKNGDIMCQVLEKKIGVPTFNIMDMVKMCALDNICETAMGVEMDAQRNPTSDFVICTKKMCYLAFLRTMRPWYRPNFIFYLTNYGREETKSLKVLHGFTRDVINKKIQQRQFEGRIPDVVSQEIGIKNRRAFLDLLLDYYEEGTLSLDEVQEEVDTFMFEGHDTITSALSFAIFEIANRSEIQDRAYHEQVEIFGGEERAPTTEDLQKMKYLEMIIKESLRLHPSVPGFTRYIEQDLKLDDFSTIPAGAEAVLFSVCIHRNPEIWVNPEVFDPDRFLPENTIKRHPYSYIPFSAGPRNCIGMKFAMMEMKSTLSKVLRKFQLTPSIPKQAVKPAMEVTLQSEIGMPISLKLR